MGLKPINHPSAWLFVFGDNPDPTASGTKINEERKVDAFMTDVAAKFGWKYRGKDPKAKTTVDDYNNVQVPADKIPTPQPVATPDKQPPAESREDTIFQALTANFARMGHAVKELSNAQLVPAGALGGGTNGKVTIGSNNSTTVNNYIEVNAQGNASAEDIAEKTAGATAQATTQATVDASDKGTFQ